MGHCHLFRLFGIGVFLVRLVLAVRIGLDSALFGE